LSDGPSTAWRETVAPDEAARFARQGEMLARIQAETSARYGAGRLAHRKSVIALSGTLQILGDLPPPARFGLFAEPRVYEAVVRLSNASHVPQPDAKPDVRGFALKALGVSGAATLGGAAATQDFLFVSTTSFSARGSDEFLTAIAELARGMPAGLVGVIRRLGFVRGVRLLRRLVSNIKRPFAGFASQSFDTLAPFTVGPYAARARLRPLAPSPAQDHDYAADMRARLAAGPIVYEIALQFFIDEARTPIEDPTVVWPEAVSPPTPVARLSLTAEAGDVEGLRFDPWGGLADHRPLGEIMRARRSAYFISQKGRGAL
jgi:hypothetical protein